MFDRSRTRRGRPWSPARLAGLLSALGVCALGAAAPMLPAAAQAAPIRHATLFHARRAPTAPPIICLRRARLLAPGPRGPGVWVAFQPGAHNTVYVEGPFRSHRLARSLARSLAATKLAVAGGPYVVIAALGIHLDGRVASVARCLRTAHPGTGGYYTF